MPSSAAHGPLHEYASRVKQVYTTHQNAAELAVRLLTLRAPFSAESLVLPLQCTEGPNKVCALLKRLPIVNEILEAAQADVIEDAPGRVSVRIQNGFNTSWLCDGGVAFENAAILLHCLVARHRCVQGVQFLLASHPRRGFEPLLCDALACAASVTFLHLNKFKMNPEATCATLAAMCRLLPSQLRELALEFVQLSVEACSSLDAWADALANTTSLKTLRIASVEVLVQDKGQGMHADFVGTALIALTRNSSISTLVVDASFAAHKDGATFQSMLASSSGPAELIVWSHHPEYSHKANLTFEALVTNTTVKKLSVENFNLGTMDAMALSKLLARSATVEDICCVKSLWDLRTHGEDEAHEEQHRWRTEHLVKGLSETTSLRRLAVRYDFFLDEIHAILSAARECKSLVELHLPSITFRELQPFHDALMETGAGPKVTIGRWIADDYRLIPLATRTWCELLSGRQRLYIGTTWNPPNHYPSVQHLCQALTCNGGDQLATLEVFSSPRGADLPAEKALASYLPSAPCLRKLVLSFEASCSAAREIIGGIIQCKSIEELTLCRFSVNKEDFTVLCEWLRASRRTHSLELCLQEQSRKPALEALASSLHSNYSLTYAVLERFNPHGKLKLQVLNLVRRNHGLLYCAVEFVLGAETKRTAEAFELISSHPQLLETVQCIGSFNQEEATSRIRAAVQRLRRNFWQLTGVVKEDLVCKVPDDSGRNDSHRHRQLGELGEYVLWYIRSFLKIRDVLDEEAEDPPYLLNETADPASAGCEGNKLACEFDPRDLKRRRNN